MTLRAQQNSMKKPNDSGIGLEEIDEAFNWLVLILSTLAAALLQYSHLYPLPFRTSNPEIQFIKVLLIPLIVLIMSWLSSHLVQNKEFKIVLKCFSWVYALLILVMDLTFLAGVILSQNTFLVASSWYTAASIASTLIYLDVIRNRYKQVFLDSSTAKRCKHSSA